MPSREALSRVGYMAQSDALFDDLDARANLRYFASLQGLRGPAARERIEASLELMELEGDSGRPVRGFSGGMRKRLSLAIALVHTPSLLVLDEPTVGMDPRLRMRMWERFRSLAAGWRRRPGDDARDGRGRALRPTRPHLRGAPHRLRLSARAARGKRGREPRGAFPEGAAVRRAP